MLLRVILIILCIIKQATEESGSGRQIYIKSELAALDHKITVELAPTHDENDGTENKQVQSQQSQTEIRTTNVEPDNYQNRKTSMVADPESKYGPREPLNSRIFIGGCGAAPPGGFRARPKL